ncbi:hypothetical protein GSI_02958 [Ganoderma sinense ZZ0214-1]|uniref:Uncharacterized protein n=1 Tax=Ganoderma sinense ZZ0214-1 TaxID=1077348 RepID=A0A2G8SN49_9APHY|nr:hypothetical protein GSI_02958 [Ganoderma sinense ZZ0214-1]
MVGVLPFVRHAAPHRADVTALTMPRRARHIDVLSCPSTLAYINTSEFSTSNTDHPSAELFQPIAVAPPDVTVSAFKLSSNICDSNNVPILANIMQFLFDLFTSGSSTPATQLAHGRPTSETAKPPPSRPSSQTNIRTIAATNAPVFF